MEIIQSILNNNPCFKAGKRLGAIRGLMLHSVGCPQPSAETFVKKWNNQESGRACVHAFIDGNSGEVYQTLPWDYRAWHCGGSGNNTHIGVEMCEPACIRYTGGATFSCSDETAAREIVNRTYNAAVELFAFLCKQYNLDPLADGVIVSHNEGHGRGIASGHGDPEHLWTQLKTGYTMDGFRKAVQQEVAGITADTKKADGAGLEDSGTQTATTVSEKGVELIAKYEGCRLEAYKCPAGVWTIGYGHTAGVKPGDKLPSKEAAKALLTKDLEKYAGYVSSCVQKKLISFSLNQNQFDALTSFVYNCGNGNLRKLVEGRDAITIADKLLLYNKGGGKVLPGLAKRREEERELFLS